MSISIISLESNIHKIYFDNDNSGTFPVSNISDAFSTLLLRLHKHRNLDITLMGSNVIQAVGSRDDIEYEIKKYTYLQVNKICLCKVFSGMFCAMLLTVIIILITIFME